jgi:DNA-binding NarL/FixJ family response regulator
MLRVLLADDHTLVREGLCRALEQAGMVVVAQASNGEEAVALAGEHRPDVVVMDLSMPVLSGVGATKGIRKVSPRSAVIVLSMLSDETAVSSALDAGATGYLVKDCTTSEIVAAVKRCATGEVVMSASALPANGSDGGGGGHLARPTPRATGPFITRREEEVLRAVATGVSLPEAAGRLFISVKTLKNHLSSIYQKLDTHDRSQAVLKAVRMGLIKLD